MAGPKYEWYATDVSGTVADLTAKLNALEGQGYEIFDVNGMLLVNAHGWVIIARTAKAATVTLHKGHKK